MAKANRPVVMTGNWKMYKTNAEAVAYVKELAPLVHAASSRIYLAVPFTAIKCAADAAKGSRIVIGAQNMHSAEEGAFTGEIAGKMLIEAGARFVILGHSERRRFFNETNAFINSKVKRAIVDHLQPVLCIGETQEERAAGKTEEILTLQLSECLAGFTPDELANLILAYEPVWAIGANQAATPEIAQQAHHLCRTWLSKAFNEDFAERITIQYGGSVKPENAQTLLDQPDIDGFLVGGAGLSVEIFSKIVNLS